MKNEKPCNAKTLQYSDDVLILALDIAIKTLTAIDDIKAEIEERVLESLSDGGDDWFTAEKIYECLDIIDKYIKKE